MKRGRRRRGERRRSWEVTVEGSPERPRRVPRRVWRGCEGERRIERREYGWPRISNVASAEVLVGMRGWAGAAYQARKRP